MGNQLRQKLVFYNGAEAKSMDIWDVDDNVGWTVFSSSSTGANKLRQFVPWIGRAENLRAMTIANMPFTIYRGETEFDTSADYQNKLGWLPNPHRFLELTERALCNYGKAYWLRSATRAAIKDLKYLVPSTINPIIDEKEGLKNFERRLTVTKQDYKPEELLYFWPPDPDVELGPPLKYPLLSALAAAGVLNALDEFSAKFIERGMVKATILSVSGGMLETDRQKLEAWWTRFMSGVKNSFQGKVLNIDKVSVNPIGEGFKELENVTLTRDKQQDIASAYDIPNAIFFSDAANYATAQSDWRGWYDTSIVPECEFIAAVLNEQILWPAGYDLQFQPEGLDLYQEDENSRAASLSQLTSAGIPLLMALDLLGYELTDEQRAELEAAQAEKQARAEELTANLTAKPEAEKEEPEAEPEEVAPEKSITPGVNKIDEDLSRWQRKALNALKRGKSPMVEFESDAISDDLRQAISAALYEAETADDVRQAFKVSIPQAQKASDLDALLAELRRANDLLEADASAG